MDDSHRLLQESGNSTATQEALTDSEILRSTLRIYGSVLAVLFVIYLLVRPHFTRAYNVRNSFSSLKCSLAEDAFGKISWTWKVFSVSYDDLFNQCGMDAVALIRILEFGIKVAVVAMLNSVYLFPVYSIGHPPSPNVTDPMQELSLANVPPGDPATIATTVSAYVVFGAAMFLIYQEFVWFTSFRHRFLSQKRPENYTVVVNHIPVEDRSNAALLDYFRECFASDSVLEAKIALDIPKLEKKVAERDALLPKLEHAMNLRDIKGETPMHKTKMCGGEKVLSIETYTSELEELNEEISDAIMKLESMQVPEPIEGPDPEDEDLNVTSELSAEMREGAALNEEDSSSKGKKRSSLQSMRSSIGSVTEKMKSILFKDDGKPRDAAFVTFSNLTATNTALQMVHHETPFVMDTTDAPRPADVYWTNFGLSHKRKQMGELVGLILTVLLCLFWTIPVGFVASLSNVESLTELLPFLQPVIENNPWFGALLAQLAPLILVVFISLLPVILLAFAKLEGHIAETTLQSSLFVKLAWFTIIQTFFVSAISGSITSELQKIMNNPASAIDLLAKALPEQSAYFMQIVLVQTFLGVGIELLRISPVAIAFIRSKVGPDLTEKERNTTWMGLRPLSDPTVYLYARQMGAKIILIFMVLFVYASMAPLTSYVCGLCFLLLAMALRNQFIYVYPTHNDGGGQLWIGFTRIVCTCMIIAEIILTAVIFLKKAVIAGAMMVPLIVVSVLFNAYIKQKHYFVAKHLPSRVCVQVDKERAHGMDYDFVHDKYKQPALQKKVVLPETGEEGADTEGQQEFTDIPGEDSAYTQQESIDIPREE